MQKIVLALVLTLVTEFAASGPAHAATWKETQKGGWMRTCHDGDRIACTVWENPTKQIICRGCAETAYKIQPPVPGEPIVKVHHVTAEEMIGYQLSNLTQKKFEDFATQFKQFTGTDFTDKVAITLQMWGDAAAVDVSMAESSNVLSSSHDTRHCPTTPEGDTTCFEQWLYTNLEAEMPLVLSEKGSQRTKMVTTDLAGRVEAVQYCQGKAGVIACVIDIDDKPRAYFFALKRDEKGLIAQIYLPKRPKPTQ